MVRAGRIHPGVSVACGVLDRNGVLIRIIVRRQCVLLVSSLPWIAQHGTADDTSDQP